MLGGASEGCSACNLQSCLWWGVNVPVSQCTRSRDNTTTPYPLIGDHLGMGLRPNAAASPVGGSICLAFPNLGRFRGGVYIYRIICKILPLARRYLGTSNKWWMVVRFAFSFREASSWTSATLPPPKCWKYEGLGLNCQW